MTTSNNNRIDSLKQTLSGPSSEASGLPTIPQSGRADMARERGQGTFAVRQMTHFLDGGPAMTAMRERFMLEMEREPSFRVDDLADLTRAQIRERYARRLRAVAHWARSESRETFQNRLNNLVILDPGFLTRVGVHYGLFANTIINQGTDEQVDMWLRRGIMDFDSVIGCFAMTELGHGSNVPGMETTATFDRAADQFVLHTPNLTATKWWIGGAAESATHAYDQVLLHRPPCTCRIVYANMLIDGKSYGVKPFVVPLRDPKTFQTCPGVTIGDNGAKMGRNGIDNGWIQFTYVRIPRDLLLMRYTKVDRQGVVEEPPLAQLAYGALLYGRCMMIKGIPSPLPQHPP
jgi:acyl-CoA oxidase